MNNGTTSWKFYHKIWQNSRNHESFFPWKFGAIRHTVNEFQLLLSCVVTVNNVHGSYTSDNAIMAMFNWMDNVEALHG